MKQYYTYILCDRAYGYLYVGVSNDLVRRVAQHKSGDIAGYTKSRAIHRLVYFEIHTDVTSAIKREKLMKRWKRQWKFNLIERDNPHWDDLYGQIS